jgi:transcriptional regulator NrdR family protein
MTHIVKRKGHTEEFDQRKIYASIYAANMTLRMTDEEAELIANTVTQEVLEIFKKNSEINSSDIHKAIVESLKKYNPDAAYMYDTHRDIS